MTRRDKAPDIIDKRYGHSHICFNEADPFLVQYAVLSGSAARKSDGFFEAVMRLRRNATDRDATHVD